MRTILFINCILILCSSLPAQHTVTYHASSEIFRNPERGFYTQFTGYSKNSQGFPEMEPVDGNLLDLFAEDHQSLILRLYYLPEFVDKPISPEFLDYIQSDLQVIRDHGFKCILRFAYSVLDSVHADTVDAPLAMVRNHIGQLTPILQKNADVIAVMQAGFVGAYGEWANYNNVIPDFQNNQGILNLSGRKAVLDALLEALPPERMIQVRTPYFKYAFYDWDGWSNDHDVYADAASICPLTNPSGLDITQAYDGSDAYRIGQHNDCFLASATDYGTYCDESIAEAGFLSRETQFTVMGGETCDLNPPRSNCSDEGGAADDELDRFHWSFLNSGYHPDVLASFKAQGCYDDFTRLLGYRFGLEQGTYPDTVAQGSGFALALSLKNLGYAAPFNPRRVEFILRNILSGETWVAGSRQDPRFWFKEEEAGTIAFQEDLGIPVTMPAGNYELLMHLPDPKSSLYGNPAFSIRLANEGVWEDSTGFNRLFHNLTIDDKVAGTPYSGNQWFIAYGCNPGTVNAEVIDYCCADTVHLEVENASLLGDHTIAWAVSDEPIAQYDDLAKADILHTSGTAIDYPVECTEHPDAFYVTPFLAVADQSYIYSYPNDLFQEYWASFQIKTFDFRSEHIPYDQAVGAKIKIELFNQDDYFSNNHGLSDIYIEYAATQEFPFTNVATKPAGEATLLFETDVDPNAIWRIRIVDRTDGVGGVFLVRFTFFIPFPSVDPNCSAWGNSVLLQAAGYPPVTTPQNKMVICHNDNPLILEATPEGGTFNGEGVTEGTFDPARVDPGSHYLTYTVYNSCGIAVSRAFELIVVNAEDTLCSTTARERIEINALELYPNPAHNVLNLKHVPDGSRIEIRQLDGKLILVRSVRNREVIPIDELPSGLYIVNVVNQDKQMQGKLAVIK